MFFRKNNQKVLLIDLHDVLTNLQEFKIQQGNSFAKKYGYKLKHPNVFETKKMFDWPDQVDEEFWNLFLPQFLHAIPPKKIVPEALYQLRREGYKIIILYRQHTIELSKEMEKYHEKNIKSWLRKYQLSYDECIVTSMDLLDLARKKHITYFISANPIHIEHMATSYPTLLFDQSYNEDLDGVHITRVSDWKEAYQILKIQNEK